MESINYMHVVPHSAFTIGDLIEIEIKDRNGNWVTRKGRVTNNWKNEWLFALIEEGVDDYGEPWQDCHQLYRLDDEKFERRNVKIIEQGPWHYLLCGDM